VEELMDLRPDTVTVLRGGQEQTIPAEELRVGDVMVLRPGEKVAADAIVLEGDSVIDSSALTGESIPKSVSPDDEPLSGSVNVSAVLKAEVTTPVNESTAARILKLVRSESSKKGRTERFISRFARYYTPAVVGIAVLLAIILPLAAHFTVREAIHRALIFLVISCPCALVISVPLAYFAGVGGASKLGILFKNTQAMDLAAKTKAVVFDKTGTLSTGRFRVTSVKSEKMDDQMFLRIAAHAEAYSNHPLAKSVKAAYDGEIYIELIEDFQEVPGKGIRVSVDGVPILLGSESFMASRSIPVEAHPGAEMALYMAIGGQYAGRLLLSDTVKDEAGKAVTDLLEAGCGQVMMLTGDSQEVSEQFARAVGIQEFHAQCLPEDKVAHVKALKSRIGNGSLLFVGDGLNDAPVLTAADVGVAMGGLGSDAAVEAADVVLMDDNPSKVAVAIRAARNTRKIVWENILFAIAVKLIIMALGVVGISTLWFAVIADVGVALAAVLNSIRAFYIK